jgi:hypothetical protein
VADMSQLSTPFDPLGRKSETLKGFAESLIPEDHVITMYLRSGYYHFRLHPDMRKYL